MVWNSASVTFLKICYYGRQWGFIWCNDTFSKHCKYCTESYNSCSSATHTVPRYVGSWLMPKHWLGCVCFPWNLFILAVFVFSSVLGRVLLGFHPNYRYFVTWQSPLLTDGQPPRQDGQQKKDILFIKCLLFPTWCFAWQECPFAKLLLERFDSNAVKELHVRVAVKISTCTPPNLTLTSPCSTTGVTTVVVCVILSVGWCI